MPDKIAVEWQTWPDLLGVLRNLPGPIGPSGDFVQRADAYWRSCPKQKREKLLVARLDYPFSSPLIVGGQPLGPDRKPLPQELLVSPSLPCGIIIGGYCEVDEAVLASKTPLYTPQALLGPGEWIGLFELLDQIVPAQGPKYPDWTISSGARTIHCLQNAAKKTAYNKIRTHHSRLHHASLHGWDEEEFKNYDIHDLLEIVKPVWNQTQGWKASVMYFSPEWFVDLAKLETRQTRRSAALAFLRLLLEAGWRAEARVRESGSELYDALVAFGGQHSVKHYEAAYQLLEKCRQIIEGRRPCFIPVSQTDAFGPWDAIIEGIVKPSMTKPDQVASAVMVPRYLRPGEVGFLPLAHIIPGLFDEDAAGRMQEVINVIQTARTTAPSRKYRAANLKVEDLFPHITIRIKTGGNSVEKAFRVPLEAQRDLIEIPIEKFYRDRFAKQPPTSSEFFRVAIRIERPPIN